MCVFKNYKNILGLPNKGLHKFRFLDTAIFDYIGALVVAIFIAYFTHIPLVLTTIGSFTFAEMLHFLFGVETNTIKYLNISCKYL
jgi:hypothetical protein